MEPLEQILQEINAFETQLTRRSFIGAALLVAVAPRISLAKDDRQFIDAVAATLIPAAALHTTGISVGQNVEHLLRAGQRRSSPQGHSVSCVVTTSINSVRRKKSRAQRARFAIHAGA